MHRWKHLNASEHAASLLTFCTEVAHKLVCTSSLTDSASPVETTLHQHVSYKASCSHASNDCGVCRPAKSNRPTIRSLLFLSKPMGLWSNPNEDIFCLEVKWRVPWSAWWPLKVSSSRHTECKVKQRCPLCLDLRPASPNQKQILQALANALLLEIVFSIPQEPTWLQPETVLWVLDIEEVAAHTPDMSLPRVQHLGHKDGWCIGWLDYPVNQSFASTPFCTSFRSHECTASIYWEFSAQPSNI